MLKKERKYRNTMPLRQRKKPARPNHWFADPRLGLAGRGSVQIHGRRDPSVQIHGHGFFSSDPRPRPRGLGCVGRRRPR
jgi:hypothetical protein